MMSLVEHVSGSPVQPSPPGSGDGLGTSPRKLSLAVRCLRCPQLLLQFPLLLQAAASEQYLFKLVTQVPVQRTPCAVGC